MLGLLKSAALELGSPGSRSTPSFSSTSLRKGMAGGASEGPPARFGFPQASAAVHLPSAKHRPKVGWISLEFLGFSRPNRAFSMGYGWRARQKNWRGRSLATRVFNSLLSTGPCFVASFSREGAVEPRWRLSVTTRCGRGGPVHGESIPVRMPKSIANFSSAEDFAPTLGKLGTRRQPPDATPGARLDDPTNLSDA